MRMQRALRADEVTNALEHDWWNENAATIARVWEMEPEVSRAVRGAYLEKAKAFFLQGRDEARVLELGCGSGWVGQSIAGPRLRIIGTDFSEAQVALARRRAEANGLQQYCSYRVASAAHWPDEARTADCALVHAFLHHLDESELAGVLRDLRTRLRPGARIWFYEPAFLPSPALEGAARTVARAFHACSAAFRLVSRALGLRDQDTAEKFERLTQRADANGWYLSPKEVPFDHGSFTANLQRHFAVRDSYWATIYLVGWAFETNLLRHRFARQLACATFLPLAAAGDRFVAAHVGALGTASQPPNYGFAVWECEVPA